MVAAGQSRVGAPPGGTLESWQRAMASTGYRAEQGIKASGEDGGPLVSVVIPCLNEAENIEWCVSQAWQALADMGLEPVGGAASGASTAEVIVVDNGSDDGSGELAAAAGARVVHEPRRGYGRAYRTGFAEARGRYIVMADADRTYDFGEIPRFVEKLEAGSEMVIGDRMRDIRPGAMPWLHRYVGNPLLTGLLNLLFKTGVSDAHCGMRALRASVLPRLGLRADGMEFASEMVVRAAKQQLRIDELPITYHARGGESKLSTFRDGWRHLRYLLVHSPTHLFILPGALMAAVGAAVIAIVGVGVDVFGRSWEIHALIAGCLLVVVGAQVTALGVCAHAYGSYFLGERERWFDWARSRFRLEHGLAVGGAMVGVGLGLIGYILSEWVESGFGSLAKEKLALVAATAIIVGVQVIFSSFLISVIGLARAGQAAPVEDPLAQRRESSRLHG